MMHTHTYIYIYIYIQENNELVFLCDYVRIKQTSAEFSCGWSINCVKRNIKHTIYPLLVRKGKFDIIYHFINLNCSSTNTIIDILLLHIFFNQYKRLSFIVKLLNKFYSSLNLLDIFITNVTVLYTSYIIIDEKQQMHIDKVLFNESHSNTQKNNVQYVINT